MKQSDKKNGFSPRVLPIVAGALIAMTSVFPAHAETAPPPLVQPQKTPPRMPAMSPSAGHGPKVTNMLAQPATVRPLPKDYLIVKKDYNANDEASGLVAARRALAQGHYDAALQLFDDLFQKNPHDSRVLIGRAVALQKLGLDAQALDAYKAALTADPKNLGALTNMLGLLVREDNKVAVEKLRELAKIYPANADIAAQLGTAEAAGGHYDQAIKYLNVAAALRPGNLDILYNKAVVYDRMGDKGKAMDLYHRIITTAQNGGNLQNPLVKAVQQRLLALH